MTRKGSEVRVLYGPLRIWGPEVHPDRNEGASSLRSQPSNKKQLRPRHPSEIIQTLGGLKDIRVLHYVRRGRDVELMIEQAVDEVRCRAAEVGSKSKKARGALCGSAGLWHAHAPGLVQAPNVLP